MTQNPVHRSSSTVTLGALLRGAAADISRQCANLPDASPRLEAELLLMEATGYSRASLFAWPERTLEPSAQACFQSLLTRRLSGEPIAYIRGHQAFWTLDLQITPDTLIPRPETELLVEIALDLGSPGESLRVADLGTGSGAIAAAVASERPNWRVLALDRSAAALSVARGNFIRLGLHHCLALRGDWLAPIAPRSLNLILANPPYIPSGDLHLTRGDPRFEPRIALASGLDGLDAIRTLAVQAPGCLIPGGCLVLEHGFDQGPAVRRLLAEHGLSDCETRGDLTGHERVTLGWAR